MTEKIKKEIGNALNLVAQANDAMINAIISVVKEDGDTCFEETIDESCGVTELRFIRYNEDGDLCVFDYEHYQLYCVGDLSTDQLYNICLKISD